MKDLMLYKKSFPKFLEAISNQDSEAKISHILWNKIAQPIKSLTETPDSFQHYWDYKNQKIPQLRWKANFEVEKNTVIQAFETKDAKSYSSSSFIEC